MTQPVQDIHVNPPVVREHAKRMTDTGYRLAVLTNEVFVAINQRSRDSGETDELMQVFRQYYDTRAPRAEERARAVAQPFSVLGETATRFMDAYEQNDAGAAANVARERGLLPPR
jgi:hypothetical protein